MNNLNQATQVALSLFTEKFNGLLNKFSQNSLNKNLNAEPKSLNEFPGRFSLAISYFEKQLEDIYEWLFRSGETSNFTYDITETNKDYLSCLMSVVLGIPREKVDIYIRELNQDQQLKNHVSSLAHSGNFYMGIDKSFDFGRRLGWYVVARAIKPHIIVETGVEQGLGSVVLCSALLKNAQEGAPGKYYGTDINTQAGYLLKGEYATVGEILYGDSIKTLTNFNKRIDLFINDSDHSAEYEWQEYLTIENKLGDRSVVLGDNAHVSDKLCQFARKTNRKFVYFGEKPKNHWYPGAGIGVAF